MKERSPYLSSACFKSMLKSDLIRPIPNLDGYLASRWGSIISTKLKHLDKIKVLSAGINKWGYYKLELKTPIRKTCKIHRLVAQTFLSNSWNCPQVNHIDEVKTNNWVNNLEWCTREYNMGHGTRKARQAKALSKTVVQMDLDGNIIKTWESASEAGRNGYETGSISMCANGKLKTHSGYKWKYI